MSLQPRTKILIVMLIFLGAVSIAAVVPASRTPCGRTNPYGRILESLRSPYYLPQYLAQNLGFFKEQNLNVTISTTSPEAIRAALADGRADIVICGLQKIIFNPASQSPQPKIFAIAATRDGSLLLARADKDMESFSWQDLKHKTIIGSSHDDSSEIASRRLF